MCSSSLALSFRPHKLECYIVSRHLPRLFQPTASAFIIALKHQPHLFFANYLGGSRKPHPQKCHNIE